MFNFGEIVLESILIKLGLDWKRLMLLMKTIKLLQLV